MCPWLRSYEVPVGSAEGTVSILIGCGSVLVRRWVNSCEVRLLPASMCVTAVLVVTSLVTGPIWTEVGLTVVLRSFCWW